MVHSLVNSGIFEDISGDAISPAPIALADPWAGIFPKHPMMEDNFHGLPFPIFDGEVDHGHEGGDMGVYDEEDDVYRCRGCMNEIVDGFCTLCNREYQPEWAAGPLLGGLFGGYGDALWADDESEDEYFEEDYEESFIDDDEGAGGGPGSDMDVALLLPLVRDDDDDVTEVDPPPVARQRNRQAPIIISSDEEDDGHYADADAHGGYGRSWDDEGDEDVDFHDARSGSEGHVENHYWSGDELSYNDDHEEGFYGYI